jgi:predicted transcriptional regulator
MTRTISIRLNDKLAAKVDKLAAVAGRPADWLIKRMIEDYIDGEIRIVSEIREVLEDDEGELIPHDVVMAKMEKKLRAKIGDAAFDEFMRQEANPSS